MHPHSRTEVSTIINQVLRQTIEQQKQNAQAIDPSYARLWQTIDDLMSAGGKRLRPYLTYLAYASSNSKANQDIFAVAAAQEFLHFALLIHDDIIDRDTFRYGRSNITGAYTSVYKAANQDAEHYANGAALMAGDLALSQAYALINNTSFSAAKRTKAINYLSESIFSVAGGELLDMEAVIPDLGNVDYFTIARYKTASYSFVGPLSTGAVLAGSSAAAIQHLRDYGAKLGIAYQLSDDLLGLYGSQETTGKPIISDLREGKKTYLFELIQQLANQEDKEYFNQIWGNPEVTIQDVYRVREIGLSTTAKHRTEQVMQHYAQQALHSISQLQLLTLQLEPFQQLVTNSINRKY